MDLVDQFSASSSVLFVPAKGASDLVIIFSDRPAGFRAKWAWTGLHNISRPDFDRLILRDPLGLWYQRGQAGLTTSFRDTVAMLSRFITERGYDTVNVLGYSAGTHAALLLSAFLKLDAVICFGCRTSLRRKERHKDTRTDSPVRKSLETLWAAEDADATLFDVRGVLRRDDALRAPIRVYLDPEQPKDSRSLKRLAGVPNVTVREYPGTGHEVHELAERAFADDPWLAGRAKYRKHGLVSALGGNRLVDALARSRASASGPGTSK